MVEERERGNANAEIIVGRGDAEIDPVSKPERAGSGHPLPASEKARHGSIPENIERKRGHGAN